MLAGGLLAGPGDGFLAGAAGCGQFRGGALGVTPRGGDRGVTFAAGGVTLGGCFRGLALGGLRALQGGAELPGQAIGLLPQLACLFPGCRGPGLGGVGGVPCRRCGLGGLGGLRGRGGRVRLGAAAGGLGLGQHHGHPAGIGRGDLRGHRGGQPGRLREQLRQPAQRRFRPVRRRRRGHRRLASLRVVVPDAALVAAELA